METKAPAAASPPPAPAAAASSPKKAQKTPVSTPAPTGDKTDSESVPSTPAGAKDENKNKKPRNRNKKPSQPKKDVAAPADAAEEGKVDKPNGGDAAAAENKSEKKPRNRPPKKQQPKKEDGTTDESKNEKDGKDEDKNTKPKNKNKNKNHNKTTHEEDKPTKIRTVKGKNTEVFEPMSKPVDLRITFDLGSARDHFTTSLTSRDVLLAPNVFNDFKPGELYAKLLAELTACGIPEERLLKMWHGNEKIDGTHLIADDKTRWKANCPTFQLVIDRIAAFFKLNVQATRFNWYKDTSQWKPFHFDAAAVKPEIAAKQNFTVGVSFGATRDAAFEHAKTRTVVSVPQPDGCVYAFARDTNVIWRHGILQDAPVRQEGRVSVIAWGWIDGMVDAPESVAPAPVTEQTKLKKKKESTN